MENASKALLMSAEILLGVLLLSILAMVFYGFNNYQSEVDANLYEKELYEFNAKFQAYEDMDLTPQDVLSIHNMVNDYNSKFENQAKITITGIDKSNVKNDTTFLNPNQDGELPKYKMKIIEYSDDGKVSQISITQNT